jgi:hypothetical protein
MLPVLLFLPVALAMRLDSLGAKGRTAQIIVICLAASVTIGVVPFTWYIHLYGGKGQGSIVRIDYDALYKDITADGPARTVLSDWHWIGNLRLADPGLVLLSEEVPDFGAQIREPAVVAWLGEPLPDADFLARLSGAGYVFDGKVSTVSVPQRFGGGVRQVSFARLKRADGVALATGQRQ